MYERSDTQQAAILVGSKKISVWPHGQTLTTLGDPTIRMTKFDDIAEYHPQLTRRILAMAHEQSSDEPYYRGACGMKVHHVERWGLPEADLLHARAKAAFEEVLDCNDAVVDLSWASVYGRGDYCMPHSHLRSTGSVVYFLAEGDDDAEDPLSGRFYFADARLAVCCARQRGCVTNPFMPEIRPGTMMVFPSQLVHGVNPYAGDAPRITLSWDINAFAIPGAPLAQGAP